LAALVAATFVASIMMLGPDKNGSLDGAGIVEPGYRLTAQSRLTGNGIKRA
jgi:secreted trypsin-like serine protease